MTIKCLMKVLALKDKVDYYKNKVLNSVCKFHQRALQLLTLLNVMVLSLTNHLKEVRLFHQICNTIMRLLSLKVLMT